MTNLFIDSYVHYQLTAEQLRQHAITRSLTQVNDTGALMISTGSFTGRSPSDKFIVKEKSTADQIDWNTFNQPISTNHFYRLMDAMTAYMDKRPEVWARDVQACADPKYQLRLRVVNEDPQSNHFAANMFIDDTADTDRKSERWLLLHAPGFEANTEIHGTRSANFTVISFEQRTILIGGSAYTGELKKAVFTILNFILPLAHNVLSMHCSASQGKEGVALFFGLSGTGKTTLSADPSRRLIGDDEHGWDEKGVFNLEGGCYAKVHNLSLEKEPGIFKAIKAGALLENTVFHAGTSTVDYSNSSITENTRVSYPLNHIVGAIQPAMAPAPANIFFLTCDAYGILPPISRLTDEQAMSYYLAGYTAKVAGTELGVKEPKAVFSPCFGAPFLPLHPSVYAKLLKEKLNKQKPAVWMVNTGWTGGTYGTGKRIDLADTRAMVNAALAGELDHTDYEILDIIGLSIPENCPGVSKVLLNPRDSWPDQKAYDSAAHDFMARLKKAI
ncbi:phosphoenolpyruvate carboxykinase (ATP) [Mucilaginibacter sp. UYP25]|uniref:phosphoenolpyruvate carboxykinase (ATP) n=1 Tax=unclassified Mucilaginibacter TaxID=2617802 RepID=UPI003391DAC3